jgi:hypothetical protein
MDYRSADRVIAAIEHLRHGPLNSGSAKLSAVTPFSALTTVDPGKARAACAAAASVPKPQVMIYPARVDP